MIVVGLTGGIGSGKTSVLQVFVDKGIPVYIADIEAKKLMIEDVVVKKAIIATFGAQSYQKNQLNRAYLASKVFGDDKALAQLNAIVHPAVQEHLLGFIAKQDSPYLIYENAILFENGSNVLCDYIITVTAPIETRIARVVKRDKVNEQQVKDRIKHQWDDVRKSELADFSLENVDWDQTLKAVEELHQTLLLLAKKHE